MNLFTRGSQESTQDPMLQGETFDEIQKIKSVLQRNLFQPYEKHLYSDESPFKQTDWFKTIKEIATTQEVDLNKNLIPCYLFAIAVDSNLSAEDRRKQVADRLDSLKPKKFKNFCYDFTATFPPAMSVNILKFCPLEAWERMTKSLLRFQEVAFIGKRVLNLMKGAAQCPWPREEQEAFIDRIFEHFPIEKGNDILCYALRDDSNRYVLDNTSNTMKNRLESLKQEIEQFGAKILGSDNSIKNFIRIPFHGSQRRYFVDWFHSHALSHPNSDLIALAFNEDDWKFLQEKVKSSYLTNCAMRWIKKVASRLENAEERKPGVWSFFSCASKVIKENPKDSERLWISGKKTELESIHDWNEVSALFSHHDLHHYLDAFPIEHREIMLKKYVMENSPKLALLIKETLSAKGHEDNEQEKINNIFEYLPLGRFPLVEYLFKNLSEKDVLMVFCTLSGKHQEELLQSLMKDRLNAIKVLSSWIKHCLDSSVGLPACVPYNLADNLYPALMN
jgi:hypothetical protein